jgi:hypothetical protein
MGIPGNCQRRSGGVVKCGQRPPRQHRIAARNALDDFISVRRMAAERGRYPLGVLAPSAREPRELRYRLGRPAGVTGGWFFPAGAEHGCASRRAL